jgi:hypothetical protein
MQVQIKEFEYKVSLLAKCTIELDFAKPRNVHKPFPKPIATTLFYFLNVFAASFFYFFALERGSLA